MGPENAMARKHDGSQTCTARSAAEPGRRTPGVSTRRSLTKARTMKEVGGVVTRLLDFSFSKSVGVRRNSPSSRASCAENCT